MYIGFEQAVSDGTVKTASDLTIPNNATGVEIQADTQNIRYTMDSSTTPTSSSGMQFLTTSEPRYFLIEDLQRIKFTQGAGGAGKLNLHYHAGRDV